MTNKEATKYLIVPVATSTKPSAEYLKQKEAYDLAVKALKDIERLKKDIERLKDENHENFVKSQHIISMLVEEIKELRGEE